MSLSGSPSPGARTRTRTRALLLQRCCSAAVTLNHIHRSLLIFPTQIGFSVFYGVFSSPWPHQMDQKIALCREEDLEVTRASLPTRVSFIRTAQVSEYIHTYISVYCIDICGGELHRQQLPLAWLAWCLYTHASLMMHEDEAHHVDRVVQGSGCWCCGDAQGFPVTDGSADVQLEELVSV